jgi:predicted Zn-dependent protease
LIFMTVMIAVVWASCLSELFARSFHSLIDSEDDRPFDPKQRARDLDRLAELVQQGRHTEAIELCWQLAESGEASLLAMEATMFRLWSEMFADDRIRNFPFLADAHRLRTQGCLTEAEAKLQSLLNQEPDNLAASLMLMRIYAQDLKSPGKADALLTSVARQPKVPPVFAKYARERIAEWSGAVPPREQTVEGIESLLVDRELANPPEEPVPAVGASPAELLEAGYLATAIEILEEQTGAQPGNFELWMQLAEAHAVYCGNVNRAARIIERMTVNAAFSPQQLQQAKARLKEWRREGKAKG